MEAMKTSHNFEGLFLKLIYDYWCGFLFIYVFILSAKKLVQTRKCEVAFAYNAQNEDELELAVGETLEILREVYWYFISTIVTHLGCKPSLPLLKDIFKWIKHSATL